MRLWHIPFAVAVIGLELTAASVPIRAQAVVTDLPIPSGGTERVAFLPAPGARATVVLLPGGEGVVQLGPGGEAGNNNFLIRTRNLWAQYGINAVVLGSPDNQSLLGQRSQPTYAAALG